MDAGEKSAKTPWHREPLIVLFGILNIAIAMVLTMQFTLFEKVQAAEIATYKAKTEVAEFKRKVAETYITRDDVKQELSEIKGQINKLIDLAISERSK
jgi:uncharacterized membrane protein YoaK (UPF0700 family)